MYGKRAVERVREPVLEELLVDGGDDVEIDEADAEPRVAPGPALVDAEVLRLDVPVDEAVPREVEEASCPVPGEVEERAVGQPPLLDVARERRSRREVEQLARVAVDGPASPETLEHRVPVEDGEALPDELVPAASHLLLDGRLGRNEAPHDQLPPREKVRRSGDRVHPPLAERLETFQRKQRGAPFLFRRQEGEPARPDDVRPERLVARARLARDPRPGPRRPARRQSPARHDRRDGARPAGTSPRVAGARRAKRCSRGPGRRRCEGGDRSIRSGRLARHRRHLRGFCRRKSSGSTAPIHRAQIRMRPSAPAFARKRPSGE